MSAKEFNEAPSTDLNLTDGANLDREKQAIKDTQDLKYLAELRRSTWFEPYYQRRLKEERDLCVKELERDVPYEGVLALRAQIRLLDKLIHMPESDRQIKWKNLHPGIAYKSGEETAG